MASTPNLGNLFIATMEAWLFAIFFAGSENRLINVVSIPLNLISFKAANVSLTALKRHLFDVNLFSLRFFNVLKKKL